MDIFDELDADDNFFLTKYNSIKKPSHRGKISIDDVDYYSRKIRINSPRSLTAMNKLGVNNEDLEYLTFKEYLQKFPGLIGEDKKMKIMKYNYVEELRQKRFEQIRELRNELKEEDVIPIKNRCYSSKLRGEKNNMNVNSKNKKKVYYSFLEKDIKSFNRVRNTYKTDLFNRMQMQLKKELLKIIKDENEKKENELNRKNRRLLNEINKEENKRKLKEEEDKIKKEKEKAKLERKEEEKRIEKLIEKTINDERLLNIRIKKERYYGDEEERKLNEFKKKMDMQREKNYLILKEKEENQENRARLRKEKLENEKKELRMSKEKKIKEKRDKVEFNLKRMEYEKEMKRKIYEENEKIKNDKKLKDEERYKKELKIIIKEIEKEKEEKLKKYKEKNEIISEQKLKEYKQKQDFFKDKQKKLNCLLKSQNEKKYKLLEEKKKKQENNLLKNNFLLEQKKQNIMNKLELKEQNLQKNQEIKKNQNALEQGKKFEKSLIKYYRFKQIDNLLENKKNELMEQKNEKDKRVEEFIEYKNNMAQKKRDVYSEIDKEKQYNNEQFDKMMNKKNINKNMLNSLKEMFPDNRKIDGVIQEIDKHLENKDKDKNKINYYDY